MTKQQFIDQIAPLVQKYAPKYSICVCSPVIAQALLESAAGTSELAVNANNYFGLKYTANRCPTANGYYVKEGSEQNPDGSYKTSVMKWMKFPNMDAGVQGYFDFLNTSRYFNLKGITSPEDYLNKIKADGYATSLKYVDNLLKVIKDNNLLRFDPKTPSGGGGSSSNVLYKVQVGAYTVKANAEAQLWKLKSAGFDGIIVEVKK